MKKEQTDIVRFSNQLQNWHISPVPSRQYFTFFTLLMMTLYINSSLGINFSITLLWAMKCGFNLVTSKPKVSQISACIHIHQMLKQVLSVRKLMANVFWDRKRSTSDSIHGTRNHLTAERNCETLANCSEPCRRGEECSHKALCSSTAMCSLFGRFLTIFHTIQNLCTNNYHLFTHMKTWLGSQLFNTNAELMGGVKLCLSSEVATFLDTKACTLIR